MSDRLGNEKGQVVAIFALMLTAFLTIAALALDSGNAYYQRRKMDIAATAAARAAAYQLATDNTSNATSTAETYAHYNGVPGTGSENVTVQYSVDGTTFETRVPTAADAYVRVTAQNPNFNTFFLGIIGTHTLSASASAAAVFGALGSANCATLFPAIVSGDTDNDVFHTYDFNFTINACFIIRDDSSSPGGGSFGWVDLDGDGGGSSQLAEWINSFALYGDTGCNNTISVGADGANLETETGTKASLQSATQNLINSVNNQVTVAIYDSFGNQSSGCTDGVAAGANLCYRVKGFGRFQITDVWLTTGGSASPSPDTPPCSQALFGADRGILGMFVGYVDPFGQVSPNAQGPAQALNVIE